MCHLSSLPKGIRVLVVDSDPDACELLAMLFAKYAIETITATCVSEALEKIQQIRPHLLISEIFLPDEDGYALIRQVQVIEKIQHVQIPAIALTTQYGRECDRVHILAAGFCKHLPKPLNIDELMTAMACIVGQAQDLPVAACYQ
jgi:two-component system, OmpR family, response regulator